MSQGRDHFENPDPPDPEPQEPTTVFTVSGSYYHADGIKPGDQWYDDMLPHTGVFITQAAAKASVESEAQLLFDEHWEGMEEAGYDNPKPDLPKWESCHAHDDGKEAHAGFPFIELHLDVLGWTWRVYEVPVLS